MKPMRRFLFCSALIGLFSLALNPQFIFGIQSKSSPESKITLSTNPIVSEHKPRAIPETDTPDKSNLPRLANIDSYPKNDLWIGHTPCSANIFDAPSVLPNLSRQTKGPFLIDPIKTSYQRKIINQRTYLYKSENGITLKYVQPVIEYYEASGLNYKEARADIRKRKPIETLRRERSKFTKNTADRPNPKKNNSSTIVGNIMYPSRLSYTITGSRDRYWLDKNKTVMTTAYYITLPRWKNYKAVSSSERNKWDDFFCKVANHELGHLRIHLDLTAETLAGYADLPPAQSYDEMEELIKEYRKTIHKHIRKRQDSYHIYNGNGGRRGMRELPYADLPFPWLKSQNAKFKTAEQSRE